MDECRITEIKSGTSSLNPIIIKFQNGKLQKGEEKRVQSAVFKNSKNKTIAAIATKNMLYTGKVQKDDYLNNYLLLKNKLTNEATLIPIDHVILSPYLKRKSQTDAIDSRENTNKLAELAKEFGSKKAKRIREQKERLKLDIENVKEDLERTVANIESNESALLMGQGREDSSYRPLIHRNAESVENVYILNQVVPEKILDTLREEAEATLSANLDELQLCPFVRKSVDELQGSPGSDVVKKCQIFLYINYLISFLNKLAKQVTKNPVCTTSSEVNSHILNHFTIFSNNIRTRPMSMRDKTICYILVLSMIASNYQLNIEDLSKDIKVGIKKIQEMGRVLAFTSASVKNRSVMILKLPLPPAIMPRLKKR